jgi:hypothetical protein
MKVDFSGHSFKNTEISDFIEIRRVGAEMFHAGGRTDEHDETNDRFSQFCESFVVKQDAEFNCPKHSQSYFRFQVFKRVIFIY